MSESDTVEVNDLDHSNRNCSSRLPEYLYLAYGEFWNGDIAKVYCSQKDGVTQLFKEQYPGIKILGIITYRFFQKTGEVI